MSSINSAIIPTKFARSMLRVAEAQGHEINRILASADMPFDPREDGEEIPEYVSAELYNRLYQSVMWTLQDESFGMLPQIKSPVGSFRMTCLMIIHCDNLGSAMKRANEFSDFQQTLIGHTPTRKRRLYNETPEIAVFELPNYDGMHNSITADGILASAHILSAWRRFCGWLIGGSIELLHVSLPGSPPDNTARYQKLFSCPVNFGADTAEYKFSSHYLRSRIIQNENTLRSFLRNAPYTLLAEEVTSTNNIIARMRRHIGSEFTKDFPSVEEMAGLLNMSVSTLRRRLNKENTTYQKFKDTTRRDAAIHYLKQPELKINAISALMGYDEPSVFHRSFKKWTEMTPGEYRNRLNSDEDFELDDVS